MTDKNEPKKVIDERPSWDDTWMDVARTIGMRSRCVRRQVGAVITNRVNRLIATGYAGPPASLDVQGPCSMWCPRATEFAVPGTAYDDCLTIHAETNALVFVSRDQAAGGTIFVNSVPCWSCCKTIANSGLVRVVCELDLVNDAHRDPHRSIDFMQQCGMIVSVRTIEWSSHEPV